MRVKCNQCGKIFEVPSTQTNRALKCVCKNIFIAEPMLQEIVEDTKAAPQTTQENEAFKKDDTQSFVSRYKNAADSTIDESTVTMVQVDDSAIDSHISFLKKNRQSLEPASSPPRSMPAASTPVKDSGDLELEIDDSVEPPSIELDIRPLPEKPPVESKILNEEAEPVASSLPSQIKNTTPPSSEEGRRQKNPSQSKKSFVPVASVSLGALIILGGTLFYFLGKSSNNATTGKIDVSTADPYLTKLIARSEGEKAERESEPKTLPDVVTPPKTVEAVTPKHAKKKTAQDQKLIGLIDSYVKGDFQEVIRQFQGFTAPAPDLKALHFEALLQRAEDDQKRLITILSSIQEELKFTPESADLLRAKAFALLKTAENHGQLEKAEKLLSSLAQTQAFDPLVFAYLGMVYARFGEIKRTRIPWDRALALEPNFVWLLETQKDLFFALDQPEEAYRSAMKLAEKSGHEARGYQMAAEIRMKQDRNEDALTLLEESLKYRDLADTRLKLAKLLERKDSRLALTHIERILARSSELEKDIVAEARHIAARLYCASGEPEKGQKLYALLLEKLVTKRLLVGKAECDVAAKNLRAAIETYERALKFDVNDSSLWLRYSQLLLPKGKTKAALEAALKSLKLKESEGAHNAAAKALLNLKNFKDAKSHIRRALQMNPQNAESLGLRRQLN